MTKVTAMIGIVVMQFGIALGNYWFTFGLWPRSWGAFALFFGLSVFTTVLYAGVTSENRR